MAQKGGYYGSLGVVNFTPGRDSNSGGGIGRLRGSGPSPADQDPRPLASTYPYLEPVEIYDDESPIDDEAYDALVAKINGNYVDPDPIGHWVDRGSLTRLSEARLPRVSMGPAPFSRKTLAPNGLGPAVGGFSADHSYTVGMLKRTGTQYGTSRAPIDDPIFKDDFDEFDPGYLSVLDTADDPETAVNKHRLKIDSILSEIEREL